MISEGSTLMTGSSPKGRTSLEHYRHLGARISVYELGEDITILSSAPCKQQNVVEMLMCDCRGFIIKDVLASMLLS